MGQDRPGWLDPKVFMGCERDGQIEPGPFGSPNGRGPDPALKVNFHPPALNLKDREGRTYQQASEDDSLRRGPQVLLHADGGSVLTMGSFDDHRRREKGKP